MRAICIDLDEKRVYYAVTDTTDTLFEKGGEKLKRTQRNPLNKNLKEGER